MSYFISVCVRGRLFTPPIVSPISYLMSKLHDLQHNELISLSESLYFLVSLDTFSWKSHGSYLSIWRQMLLGLSPSFLICLVLSNSWHKLRGKWWEKDCFSPFQLLSLFSESDSNRQCERKSHSYISMTSPVFQIDCRIVRLSLPPTLFTNTNQDIKERQSSSLIFLLSPFWKGELFSMLLILFSFLVFMEIGTHLMGLDGIRGGESGMERD